MKLILANLKMFQNKLKEIDEYIKALKGEDIIVLPSYIYLERFIKAGFKSGVQNISPHEKGAYTGEVSASAVKDMGALYALIGHSEIQKNLNEPLNLINQKIKSALNNDLKVILCIGESKRCDLTEIKKTLKKQLEYFLKDIKEEVIISYEPAWSIGNGKVLENKDIENVISYIKSLFNYNVKVLYGGSVSSLNIDRLNKIKNVDGFLIGKAATDIDSFKKIIEVVWK